MRAIIQSSRVETRFVARTAFDGKTVYIPDALADPEYTYGGRNLGGYRTCSGYRCYEIKIVSASWL